MPDNAGTSDVLTEKSSATFAEDESVMSAEDQVRAKLSADLDQPVDLVIEGEYQYKQWHFLFGYPVTDDGLRIDISRTVYAVDFEEGYFDDVFMALLALDEQRAAPELQEWSYGATDAPFIVWAEQHNLPMCLFTGTQPCE